MSDHKSDIDKWTNAIVIGLRSAHKDQLVELEKRYRDGIIKVAADLARMLSDAEIQSNEGLHEKVYQTGIKPLKDLLSIKLKQRISQEGE